MYCAKSGSTLWQFTIKLFEFWEILTAGGQEGKKNAGGEIQTNNLDETKSNSVTFELLVLPFKIRVSS